MMSARRALAPVLCLLLLAAPAALADEPRSKEDQEKIDELERKIELLTDEFERLREGRPEADADEADGDEPLSLGRWGLAPSASKIYRTDRGVSIGGYGEWLYQDFDDTLDDGTSSPVTNEADFLRLVLYTGYRFSDRVLLNTEIEYEHGSTESGGAVSVEFAYLDFLLRDEVNVRTGLVLIPVGLVNEIHEPTTFFGVRRPDVERVILPTTWRELGAGVFGEAGPFSYRAYVTTSLEGDEFSASSGLRGGRQKGAEAEAEDLAVSGRVDFSGVPGLLLGVSAFRGDTGQGETLMGETVDGTVTTFDVHGEYRWRGLQVRGLLAQVDVDDAEQLSALAGETIGSEMDGWYLEAGFDVFSLTGLDRYELTPFVRVEEYDTQKEVPAALAGTVTGENDREVTTFGVVFKPLPQIAVKLDVQDFDNAAGTGRDQINLGVGFAF